MTQKKTLRKVWGSWRALVPFFNWLLHTEGVAQLFFSKETIWLFLVYFFSTLKPEPKSPF